MINKMKTMLNHVIWCGYRLYTGMYTWTQCKWSDTWDVALSLYPG